MVTWAWVLKAFPSSEKHKINMELTRFIDLGLIAIIQVPVEFLVSSVSGRF